MKRLIGMIVSKLFMMEYSAQDSSVGVIGGADGPTSVFVTSSTNWWIVGLIAAAVVAVVVVICIRKKNK